MRKVLALLLLGAAAPAMAAGAPGDGHGWRHSGQQSASEDSSNRSDRADRPHADRGNRDGGNRDGGNRGAGNDQPPPQQLEQQQQHQHNQAVARAVDTNGAGNGGERHWTGPVRGRFTGGEQPALQPTNHDNAGETDSVRNWRSEERQLERHATGPKMIEPGRMSSHDGAPGTLRQHDRAVPNVFRNRVPVVSNVPREGTQPPLRAEQRRTRSTNQWSASHWRNDHRYDWQSHRRHHRSLFHVGFYYDPFGWNYRPYSIGWRLWPSYYSSRYWINDPWQYRLPYAPPGYRWVRYWDDAILVDTWSGEVVDVIRDFFW